MFNRLKLITKLVSLMVHNKNIGIPDYSKEYDQVSNTYDLWLNLMSKHTDKLIHQACKEIKCGQVLDLACGSGYITHKVLTFNTSFSIDAVDISLGMINKCRSRCESVLGDSDRVNYFIDDALSFLTNTSNSYDIIFCGWALEYLDQQKVLELVAKRLKPNGIAAFICNQKGTLQGLKSVYLKVMELHRDKVQKVLTIDSKLPKDEREFQQIFINHKLTPVYTNSDEEIATFKSATDLLRWLNETGANAGTTSIFNDYQKVEYDLVNEISEQFKNEDHYQINHKFVYGVFKQTHH